MKVLITRTDRLGDTILASPTWQALKDSRPECDITLLAREDFRPLFESDPALSEVLSFPAGDRSRLDELAGELSSRGFDALIALYVDRDVARLIGRIRAPLKVGPLSKPRTWFLFNRPLRQGRSRSLLHEADYNGLLLKGVGVTYRPCPPRVVLSPRQRSGEGALLERIFGKDAGRNYLVVHPGMGGSAANWPPLRYRLLVEDLLERRQEAIVVTGTSADRPYLESLRGLAHPRLTDAVGKVNIVELALLLGRASLFVGPSTGPMHLATALGTPVVALFSPLGVQQPRRWGPYHSPGTVLTPPVTCPERHRCPGKGCPDYDCMEGISVEEVSGAVHGWLDRS